MNKQSGLLRAFGRQIYEMVFFDEDRTLAKDTSPYKYIRYYDEKSYLRKLEDRVYTLMRMEIPMTHFGLTLKDVFSMDYASFEELEERVGKIIEPKREAMKNQEKQMQELMKSRKN